MNQDTISILSCPVCNTSLSLRDEKIADGEIFSGKLVCDQCGAEYLIESGVPILLLPELTKKSKESWLGEPAPGRLKARLWYVCSNLFGLLFSPILAVFAWLLDFYMILRGGKAAFAISDIRGLLFWHLRFRRPYNHLRMLEHALVIAMIRNTGKHDSKSFIVDIGAEKSLFCSYLAKIGYRAVALDLDRAQMLWQKSLHNKYKKHLKQPIDFIVGSATSLPIKDNSANLCAISVIEHIEEDQKTFLEIGRVTGSLHYSIISFLYQDFPLREGQAEAAWNRAREFHPAYGLPRDIDEHILIPSNCRAVEERYFWKKLCRLVKNVF